ncbi:phosphotransferase [Roseibium sp. M-1]
MPHTPADTPATLPADIRQTFRLHPQLAALCGRPLGAVLRSGLTNRVYRLNAEKGAFFLRLPATGSSQTIDRQAEAQNLAQAAEAGLALPPAYCDPASGILVTRSVSVSELPPEDGPDRLGNALGQLHASGADFKGVIDADGLRAQQMKRLGADRQAGREMAGLATRLERFVQNPMQDAVRLVPSHGDMSPGNCLFTHDGLWLIDWEYSAMADPAWDLAYAILEHGYQPQQERRFLNAYGKVMGTETPVPSRHIEIMKSKCDAVSAFWALEQVAAGREEHVFLPFARARRDRALQRLDRLQGQVI